MNDNEIFEICEDVGLEFEYICSAGVGVKFKDFSIQIGRIGLQNKKDFLINIMAAIYQVGYEQGRNSLRIDLRELLNYRD